jgi:tRNA pseudouridine55 synthase
MEKFTKKVFVLNKKEGETPLGCLGRFRSKNKSYLGVKMTYAGRLDPMASGLMLVLAGEETKNKEKYLGLDKEYEFEILFGFSTDTYDILGKVQHSHILKNIGMLELRELEKTIKSNLKYFRGKFTQKYPIYSSKTVKGKQLFQYARGSVDVEVPSREINVKKLQFIKLRKINNKKLLTNIEKRIRKIKGDFRQKEILKIWHQKLNTKTPQQFSIGSFKIKCGSGTYVRGIANSLGEKIDLPTLAFSIKRTKIGKFGKIQ